MPGEIESYVSLLEQMREAVRDELLGLDANSLNWRPLPEATNSVYNLAQHSAWVERWWIGSVLASQPFPYEWSNNEDLEGRGEDAADLLFWLDEAASSTREVVERLTPDELAGVRTRTRSDGSEQ